MSTPRSIRFESDTLARIASYSARHPGMTASGAVALLVEEGLRMDAHPGVVFRDGPTGRRAVLVAGPDVWEVVRAIRGARAAEPDLGSEEVLDVVCDSTGLSRATLRVALGYYGSFADEIDSQIAAADEAEAELVRALARTNRLLDR